MVASRFVVESLLGVGGGGSSVWVARETAASRQVALKLLPVTDAQEAARFERGAILSESLTHPQIARVFEHGRDGDLLWISMELLAGETLASLIASTRSVDPRDAVLIADQILSALEHAHAAEIVHRDLKPANLFVTGHVAAPPGAPLALGPEARILILDFGIARLVGPSAAERFGPFFPDDDPIAPELETEVTGQHRICGTPEYMAPEQILGAPPDVRSDLYALGVILYRMIGGQLPFRARTRYEIYHRHLHEVPPPLPPTVPAPLPLAAAIHRALAKKPEDRFQSAAAMREVLRAAIGLPPVPRPKLFPTEPGQARPVSAPSPTSTPAHSAEASEAAPGLRVLLQPEAARPDPTPANAPSTPHEVPPHRTYLRALVVAALIAAAILLAFLVLGGSDNGEVAAHSGDAPVATTRH